MSERIGVEKPWEPTNYPEKMRARRLRCDRGKERLKEAQEKYGEQVWIDADGWLHTGESAIE